MKSLLDFQGITVCRAEKTDCSNESRELGAWARLDEPICELHAAPEARLRHRIVEIATEDCTRAICIPPREPPPALYQWHLTHVQMFLFRRELPITVGLTPSPQAFLFSGIPPAKISHAWRKMLMAAL